MIQIEKTVAKGLCDACGKPLSSECQTRKDGTPHGVHYGALENHFGFGSNLDGIDNYVSRLVLCEGCYTKAMKALNLPLSQHQTPWHIQFRTERFGENETGKYWHEPVWSCTFCDWTEKGRGYSIPSHACANVEKILVETHKTCGLCRGENAVYQSESIYSEREDAWIHIPKPDTEHPREDSLCQTSELRLSLMRAGERIDPEFHRKVMAGEELLEKRRKEREKKEDHP